MSISLIVHHLQYHGLSVQDSRIAAIEAAAAALAEVADVSGGAFLARRFVSEAWPVLEGLLARGPPPPRSNALTFGRESRCDNTEQEIRAGADHSFIPGHQEKI